MNEEIKEIKEKKKFNKKYLMFGLPILCLVLVSAFLLVNYGQIQQDVNVKQAVTLTGGDCVNNVCPELVEDMFSGDTLVSEVYTLSNLANTPRVVKLVTSSDPWTTFGEIVTTPIFELSIPLQVAPNLVQDRVVMKANIVVDDITTLDFEYMLTTTTTGNSPYFVLAFDTTDNGEVDTWAVSLQDIGVIDTWNTHGNGLVYHNVGICTQTSLCDLATLKTQLVGAKLLQVKAMIGYWGDMTATTALVKNIEINDVDIVETNGLIIRQQDPADLPDDTNGDVIVDFSIETYFPKMMLPDTYTITTTVDAL